MTAATWPETQCPACLSASSMLLDAGGRLCLDCQHEWDPATTTGPATVTSPQDAPHPMPELVAVADIPMPPAKDLLGALEASLKRPADDDYDAAYANLIETARAQFVGKRVLYHDAAAEGVVAEVDDDGLARVEFGSGFQVFATPDEFSVIETAEPDDATIASIGIIDMAIAATVIRAGAAALVDGPDGRSVTMPPEGYLPEDVDAIPVIEHGASYAVAILALAFGMPTEQLLDAAQRLDDAAVAAKEANGQ